MMIYSGFSHYINIVIFHSYVNLPEGKYGHGPKPMKLLYLGELPSINPSVLLGYLGTTLSTLSTIHWPLQVPKLEVPNIYKAYVRHM